MIKKLFEEIKQIMKDRRAGGQESFSEVRKSGGQEDRLFNDSSLNNILLKSQNDTALSSNSPIALLPLSNHPILTFFYGASFAFAKKNLSQNDTQSFCSAESVRGRKLAFTLAEVLITLGVIGVVATITLPALIKNYQKYVWVRQLQKSYSILNQGFKKMLADEEVTSLENTKAFLSTCGDRNNINSANCKNFFDNLQNYFKVASIYKDGNNTLIKFTDGTIMRRFTFYNQQPDTRAASDKYTYLGEFWIDINGNKAPNYNGLDRFHFYLTSTGDVYPLGSKVTSEIVYGDETTGYWKSFVHAYGRCFTKQGSILSTHDSVNDSCAARVLELGKMDY